MFFIGWIAVVLIGVALGLVGGGGSVLTIPVLVYLFGVDPVRATAYSLLVVGFTAGLGAVPKWRQGMVDVHTAVSFGIPSIIAVYLTRAWVLPAIPNVIYSSGDSSISKNLLIMLLFAVLMLAASVSMIRGTRTDNPMAAIKVGSKWLLLIMEGAVVGFLTGLVGAGGGFLIIPALVLITGLSMPVAVGTSLLIISSKSLIGFLGDLQHQNLDWQFLSVLCAVSAAGMFVGNVLGKSIQADKLRKGFGWFILCLGILILVMEIY